MQVGDMVRVKRSVLYCYPRYEDVIGLVVNVRKSLRNTSVRFMHSDLYTSMPIEVLEVINGDR